MHMVLLQFPRRSIRDYRLFRSAQIRDFAVTSNRRQMQLQFGR